LEAQQNEIISARKEAKWVELACPSCSRPYPDSEIESRRTAAWARVAELEANLAPACYHDAELAELVRLKNQATAEVSRLNAVNPSSTAPECVRLSEIVEGLATAAAHVSTAEMRQRVSVLHAEAVASGIESDRANRVKILQIEEGQLRSAYELDLNVLWLIDQHDLRVSEIVTQAINGLFSIVKWRMFEDQINGGIAPVCEAIVDTVPYSSGLNYSARINAGIDVCIAYQRYRGADLPIWIDNTESINEPMPTPGQSIHMTVTTGPLVLTSKTN